VNNILYRFEVGTPKSEDVIGLGTAIGYLTKLGLDKVARRESEWSRC
jgi:selenocysteine lyase/cysteine desulfurase